MMSKIRNLKSLATLLVLGLFVTTAAIAGVQMEPVWKAEGNLKIASGASETLTFPVLKKKKGYSLCIFFKAYIYNPKPAGWNQCLAIAVNGTQINKFNKNGKLRLLCRGAEFTSSHPNPKDQKSPWWRFKVKKPSLMVYYGSGVKDEIDNRINGAALREGYCYQLDIADLVSYVKSHKVDAKQLNSIVFTNTMPTKYKTTLRVEDIQIGYVKNEIVDKARDTSYKPEDK